MSNFAYDGSYLDVTGVYKWNAYMISFDNVEREANEGVSTQFKDLSMHPC